MEKLEKLRTKKVLLLVVVASLLAGSGISAYALTYWSRNVQIQISVKGIVAELYNPTYAGFANKEIATTLTNNNIFLSVLLENYATEIYSNITILGIPTGLVYGLQGQYVHVWNDGSFGGGGPKVDLIGSPFNVLGYHVLDKTKTFYSGGSSGNALLLTWSWDGGSALPSNYDLTMKIDLGFVGM